MSKQASLYRMKTNNHICPYGLKSLYLLKKKGYDIKDNTFKNRDDVEQFKKQHQVKTTPQTFIDNERIGGYDDLRKYFGLAREGQSGTTYKPVIAIFSLCFASSLALTWHSQQTLMSATIFGWFIGISMVVLAIQKLRDLTAFSNQFITYDLLAMRHIPYAYIYPFAEAYAGFGMLLGESPWLFAPISLFIGSVGAVSVFKAVYIDKRELKCACVGGDSNVPLGFVSLTENLFMIFAAFWMLV